MIIKLTTIEKKHRGHVTYIFRSTAIETPSSPSIPLSIKNKDQRKFKPREEIVVTCSVQPGHSGGPCVNQQGECIGILSRSDPADRQRCYLVPTNCFKEMIKKAKKRCSSHHSEMIHFQI